MSSTSIARLVTISGEWTTYRRMAEDCVDQAATLAQLSEKPCVTHHLQIHGFHDAAKSLGALGVYGSDATEIRKLMESDPRLSERLHATLPYVKAEVVWAVREEMARTVEDVLARRTRAATRTRAAIAMAPVVADLMASELNDEGTYQAGRCVSRGCGELRSSIQKRRFDMK
jgi:glycerol-3-phosphate dehydrogenase